MSPLLVPIIAGVIVGICFILGKAIGIVLSQDSED